MVWLFGDLPSLDCHTVRLPEIVEHEVVPLSAFTLINQHSLRHKAGSRLVSSFCDRALEEDSDTPHSEPGPEGGRQCEETFCAMMGINKKKTCEPENCVNALGHMNHQVQDMNKEVEGLRAGLSKSLTMEEVKEHIDESHAARKGKKFVDLYEYQDNKDKKKPGEMKLTHTTSVHALIKQIKQQMKANHMNSGTGAMRQSFRPLAESLIVEAGPKGLGAEVKQFAFALHELGDKVDKNLTKEKIAMMTSQDVPDQLKDTILALNEVLAGGTYLRSHLNKFSELANLGLNRAEIVGHANLQMGHTPVSPMEEEEVAMQETQRQKDDPGHLGPYEDVVKQNPESTMRYEACLRALQLGQEKKCHPETLARVKEHLRGAVEDLEENLKDLQEVHRRKAEAISKRNAVLEKDSLVKEPGVLETGVLETGVLEKGVLEKDVVEKGFASPDVSAIIIDRLWKSHSVVARSRRNDIKHFL